MNMKSVFCSFVLIFSILVITSPAIGMERNQVEMPSTHSDDRPLIMPAIHNLTNLYSALFNIGLWGDPYENYPSMEWPGGEGSSYLWGGDLWSSCYGNVTIADSTDKWASCCNCNGSYFELRPSEGWPLYKLAPGPVAPEQTMYGVDDWDIENNLYPYGLFVRVDNYTWNIPGYNNFMAMELVATHHSEYGKPGVPLDGLVLSIRGDCDVASADVTDHALDDLVYYDGHAIWCNDPDATFEYVFDGSVNASTQDDYTYQQNPDNPLPSDDPDNIHYYYNYLGSDGIPDNDVDQNGVSDHFTILAKVVGSDTLYWQDPESGVILFSEGLPYWHYNHTVGDTTYLVVPRNLSYMWDSDNPATGDDDSGEPGVNPICNGYLGWRLLDFWVVKADKSIERPIDVYGYPIPISHTWWNWEDDPETDSDKYDYMWGINPDYNGQYSGPAYLSDWYGNPCAPEAILPENPGPFPIVHDSPLSLSYPVFDYRFLMSLGPVNLEDGDSLHVVGGWVIGRGLDGLRVNADLLLDAYYRESIWGSGLGIEGIVPLIESGIAVSPNPLSSNGVVNFSLNESCMAVLSIYDVSGRLIDTLLNTELTGGDYSINVDAAAMNAGVYMVRLQAGENVSTGRFILLH